MSQPRYIDWFVNEESVVLEDGEPIFCYSLDYIVDEDIYYEWALHIRRHYESDEELNESIKITGMSLEDYLRTYVIPQKSDTLGSIARSNDFTEIMISDLLEFIHKYTVPRCKQRNRSGKTQSEHGTDILAYKYNNSFDKPDSKDELLAVEVKAGLTSDKYTPIIDAVTDSHKFDEVRHAFTLNFYRKKLFNLKEYRKANEIARFQKKSEIDFVITYVAAAIISRNIVDNNTILGIRGKDLELRQNNKIFLVHGNRLMQLAHDIFERCIK